MIADVDWLFHMLLDSQHNLISPSFLQFPFCPGAEGLLLKNIFENNHYVYLMCACGFINVVLLEF